MSDIIKKNKVELLAPAGSVETFHAVICAGADAVYLGGSQFGARAYASNFSEEELLAAIDYAHIHDRQVYLTVNTLFKETELEKQLFNYLLPYYKQGLDAVIIQDMGAFSLIKKEFPDLDIHTSTQMTIKDRYGAKLMKQLGASRVVTAREMSLEEIKDIHDHVDVEIESFVHGALCYCYSGQCLLSSILGGRSGNRGRCAQPCRLPYEVYDENFHPIKNARKQKLSENYILSPKDLCTIETIPQLVESGIYSFKIEGRMKQAEYAAGVVSVYRDYLDRYLETGSEGYHVSDRDMQKLYDFGNRSGFTEGYYHKHNGKDMITFEKPNHAKGNENLQAEIRQKYIQTEIKEKIKGNVRLFKESPAIIEISCKGAFVRAEGDVVQAALKQPLSKEKIEANIKKTGSTPFEFESLTIEMEEDIFLPVQSLNRLRREVIEKVNDELTNKFRRHVSIPASTVRCEKDTLAADVFSGQKQHHFPLAVSIENRNMLSVVLDYAEVDMVYLDSSCYTREQLCKNLTADIQQIHSAGKKAFYMMPTVFCSTTAAFYSSICETFQKIPYDGIVVKSFDELAFVKEEFGKMTDIVFDHNMYTYNHRAKEMLFTWKPLRDTVPLELNRKELFRRDNRNSEIIIYGNLPLMTSAQCVHANMGKCDKEPTVIYLKDRYGKYFPVKNNCMECYNTIYNTMPLMLFSFREDFLRMGLKNYRISFTLENEEQIRAVMKLYEDVFRDGKTVLTEAYSGEYTNGHYKRGVE